jgi:hypothetical protein
MLTSVREVFERFVFDPSFVDLVLWYPHLGWSDFAVSTATVIGWRLASERMERFMTFHIRRVCAHGLVRLATYVLPDGAEPYNRAAAPKLSAVKVSRRFAAGLSRRWASVR